MNTFSERIKQLRNDRSQQDVADSIGVTKNKWSTWELGKYEPDLETLTLICEKFNVSADWILGLQDVQAENEPAVHCANRKMSNISNALIKISETTRELAEGLAELGKTL